MWRSKGEKLNWNRSPGVVIVSNGLDSSDSGICNCICARSGFDKCGLPSIDFMKSSTSIVTEVHLRSRGLRVSRWPSKIRGVWWSLFTATTIGMARADEIIGEKCLHPPFYLSPLRRLSVVHAITFVALETPDHHRHSVPSDLPACLLCHRTIVRSVGGLSGVALNVE